uniref:Methylosome protein 50 n=1 Tax=Timema genevievae TaxID=629358 RepID=A0A7R9K089_TIMGE|nr:unnamed protein product [Timema genevievae]
MDSDYFEVIIEPNRNAEAYRNYVPPDLPALVENYIDFIEFCADGYMLLGSSNLTGRHWCGSLWYFIDPDGAPDVEKCLTGMTCENGVCDGKFLSDRQKILIGEDSGTLQVLALSESPEEHTFHFSTVATACGHDDSVLSVDVFAGEKRAVTGSADMNIKVWNTEALECEHTYRTAHTHHVTSVSAHPQENNSVFASCSLDGTVYMWDTRQTKPASGKCFLIDGTVYMWDTRQTKPASDKASIKKVFVRDGTIYMLDTGQMKPASDSSVNMWDTRQTKPASGKYTLIDGTVYMWDTCQTRHTLHVGYSSDKASISTFYMRDTCQAKPASDKCSLIDGTLYMQDMCRTKPASDKCSLIDGTVHMWDTCQTKPASVVMKSINPQSSPSFTSVSWQPSKSGVLAIGSSIGTVTLTDTRLLKPFIQFSQFDRSIYRLRFADHNYSDDRHEDFVRGLAWNPKTEQLYSCGWDKKVLVHSPSPNMNTNVLASSATGDDFKKETTNGIVS